MEQPVNIDFGRALVNIEDGRIAVSKAEDSEDDIQHFRSEAKQAFDGVPREIPYVRDCVEAIEQKNFEDAFEALANLASYVEQYDESEYTFHYNESSVERVQDQYRN